MSDKRYTEAFVLRAVSYGERDVIVTLLTADQGRISALAKNARSSRRFAGGLQPLRKARVLLQHKPNREMQLFLEMEVQKGWSAIEKSYDKITIASYATELLRELAREDAESAKLIDLLEAFYDDINVAEDDLNQLETILRYFQLRLLERFGASPSLYHCHRCGLDHKDMERLQCTRSGEGLLCVECRVPGEATGILESRTLELLHDFDKLEYAHKEAREDAVAKRQARRILQTSFENILEKDLKSKAMLDTVLT